MHRCQACAAEFAPALLDLATANAPGGNLSHKVITLIDKASVSDARKAPADVLASGLCKLVPHNVRASRSRPTSSFQPQHMSATTGTCTFAMTERQAPSPMTADECHSAWLDQLSELEACTAVHPDTFQLVSVAHAAVPQADVLAVMAGNTSITEFVSQHLGASGGHEQQDGPGSSQNASFEVRSCFAISPELPDAEISVKIALDSPASGMDDTEPMAAGEQAPNADKCCPHAHNDSAQAAPLEATVAQVAHLPPVSLTVTAGPAYPSTRGPDFELHASWLAPAEAQALAQRLVDVWEAAGPHAPVLLLWADALASETTELLGLSADGLTLRQSAGEACIRATSDTAPNALKLVRHVTTERRCSASSQACKQITMRCIVCAYHQLRFVSGAPAPLSEPVLWLLRCGIV